MSVRHLSKQPILCCRHLRASPPPLRLLPAFPLANTLIPAYRRSVTDITRSPRDVDIRAISDTIRYIDANGNFLGVQPLWYILDTMDEENYHLVCINPYVTEGPPTCKIISKEKLRALYLAKKAKKVKDPSKVTKTIEISWATEPNDLGHKVRKITEFLRKGNRVDVILGVKKGMAKQPLKKMVDMVSKIREQAEQWGKEWKGAEGLIGIQYLIYFEGKPPIVEAPVEGTKATREKPVEEAKIEENPVGGGVEITGENPVEEVKVIEEIPIEEAKIVEENPVEETKFVGEKREE